MRILHTSDWHLGKSFHGHSTLAASTQVLTALVTLVREHRIDVVVVAGDIFDTATPSGDVVEQLDHVLVSLREAGANVILTSGNHDSAKRLGAKAVFAAAAGVHVITRPDQIHQPVTLHDAHGPVHFYGIPFLEPALLRSVWPDQPLRSQKDVLSAAMELVRTDTAARGGRSVVMAHTFVAGAEGESCESERDIVGTLDRVPKPIFDGIDYVALGHIHGRSTLEPHLRYSGAPLHLSFSEADKPRGAWLVDLDDSGLAGVTWLDLPIPRPLVTLVGPLTELLTDTRHDDVVDAWVRVVLTDDARPHEPMRKLLARFPHCALLEHRPAQRRVDATSYAHKVRAAKSDRELIDAFVAHVRNGVGLSRQESDLVEEVLAAATVAEVRS